MKLAFTPRLTRPEAGNKYYITKSKGGYSNAVKGNPTDSKCDVLSNCVGYAYGRFSEIGGYKCCKYLAPVNAENFIEYAGSCKVGQVPQPGACMVWQKGATLKGSDGAGHVAIVEKVISSTEVVTSESGWGCSTPFYTKTRKKGSDGRWGQGSAYKFRGFIYNPAVPWVDVKEPKSKVIVEDGIWGKSTTIYTQKLFKLSADGIISGQKNEYKKYCIGVSDKSWRYAKTGSGSPTIVALQKLVKVQQTGQMGPTSIMKLQKFLKDAGYTITSVDGYMGKETVVAWQKYLNSKF